MKFEGYICDRCGEEIKDNIFLLSPECVDKKDGESLVGLPDDISNELYALMEDKHLCFKCIKDVLEMIYGHSAVADKSDCPDDKADDKCEPEGDDFINLMKKYASEGRTIRELQDATGASYSKINNAAIRHGVKFKKHKYIKSDKPEKTDVASETTNTVIQTPCKNEDATSGLNYDNIIELYCNQGKNMHCIAKEIGATVEEVRTYIMKNRIFKNKNLQDKYNRTPQLSAKSWDN